MNDSAFLHYGYLREANVRFDQNGEYAANYMPPDQAELRRAAAWETIAVKLLNSEGDNYPELEDLWWQAQNLRVKSETLSRVEQAMRRAPRRQRELRTGGLKVETSVFGPRDGIALASIFKNYESPVSGLQPPNFNAAADLFNSEPMTDVKPTDPRRRVGPPRQRSHHSKIQPALASLCFTTAFPRFALRS